MSCLVCQGPREGEGCVLPSRVRMHARMAMRAPVLRPADSMKASVPQDWGEPSPSHSHTRMESVLVLLRAGVPLSTMSTGSRYIDCCLRWKPVRLVKMEAVLSGSEGGGRK